jgi:hypothetical protein
LLLEAPPMYLVVSLYEIGGASGKQRVQRVHELTGRLAGSGRENVRSWYHAFLSHKIDVLSVFHPMEGMPLRQVEQLIRAITSMDTVVELGRVSDELAPATHARG